MKDELLNWWSDSATRYDKVVVEGMACEFENKGWQAVFTEVIGTEKLSILDVGTGPGVVAFQLTQLGHNVTGVDFSDEMLKVARKNADLFGLNVKFQKGEADDLPFQDGTFDVVVSKYVLWTIPDPDKALKEWYRVVKPGGKVVYVDGNWTTDLERSWIRRRWKGLVSLHSSIMGERKGQGHIEEYQGEDLWSVHADRPATDLEKMKEIGFVNVGSQHIPYNRVLRGKRRFKYGYYDGNFLVTGTKR
jgi:ubiquinone/menaquinone biosynthesis C-methylase UbiE